MIGKISWLFKYYVIHHMEIYLPALRIEAADNSVIGYLEKIQLRHGRIYLRGWCLTNEINFCSGDFTTFKNPSIERSDVAAEFNCRTHVGFEASLPSLDPTFSFSTEWKGERIQLEVVLPGKAALRREQLRLSFQFLRRMTGLVPKFVIGTLRHDPRLRDQVKTALGLNGTSDAGELDPQYFKSAKPPTESVQGVTIIMPVHNAFDVTCEAIERVVANTEIPWRLIIIEDCSTDHRVRPWLRSFSTLMRMEVDAEVELIENDTNLGFIGSVNAGLKHARRYKYPIVLLNSDAFVPAGWAKRLLTPLLINDSVASVTPMSNDAEIFSVPAICKRTELGIGQAELIDDRAQNLAMPDRQVEVPTGVGFCMAMSQEYLEHVPRLDAAFGRGYGEEVDWCLKTAALGGRHVVASNLFVEHRGGESFGSITKQKLVANNNALIARRYPSYDAQVQKFILRDPLLTPRLVLALAYLDSLSDNNEISVYIAHTMGGGAENYLQNLLKRCDRGTAVILRLGGSYRFQIEVITSSGMVKAGTADFHLVRTLIRSLRRRRIIYSCAVGDSDPAALPDILLELADGGALEVLFHDYFPISPSYTLLDSDWVYRGTPLPSTKDSAHQARRANGEAVSLADWQAAWGRVMAASERVVVFSSDSRTHVERAYPEILERIEVQPHEVLYKLPQLPSPSCKPLVIGVLGNIGVQKGAAVVQALSHRVKQDERFGLALLGRLDPSFPLSPGVPVHGHYEHADLPVLADRYQISAWLIPSIWPETFSYTTHECLSTGLPTLAFDLGAQGEAVSHAPNGRVVPLPREATDVGQLADAILNAVQSHFKVEANASKRTSA